LSHTPSPLVYSITNYLKDYIKILSI
jgi:hypothetical protein